MVLDKQLYATKGPLKGKGGFVAQSWAHSLGQWHRDSLAVLRGVHSAMQELSLATQAVEGRAWSLLVYVQRRTARQLRWRRTDGRHTLWQRIEPQLAQLPPALAQWYRETDEAAVVLNHQEQVARYQIKTVARLLQSRLRRT